MSGARVLAVDDDPAILRAVRRALEARGYAVTEMAAARGVAAFIRDSRPDVVLLDLVLPDGDGIAICREVRRESRTPIIVLSAVGDERKKVEALDEGADDYLTKPFSMDELLARVRVALRHGAGASRSAELTAGPLRVDLEQHAVSVAGQPVHLTPREFELCRLLVQNEGRILTQRQILSTVWGPEYADDTHILRTFIHQLRNKLGDAGAMILNDPGVGYRLVLPRD